MFEEVDVFWVKEREESTLHMDRKFLLPSSAHKYHKYQSWDELHWERNNSKKTSHILLTSN